MEFEISRTSMWNDKKPCEEVYEYNGVDYTFKYNDGYIPRVKHLMDTIALTAISLSFAEVEVLDHE